MIHGPGGLPGRGGWGVAGGGVAREIWGGFCLEPGPLPEAGEGMTGAGEALGRWDPPAKIKTQALSLGH